MFYMSRKLTKYIYMVYCNGKTKYNSAMRDMKDTLRKELGEHIRELRKISGITQEELGEKSVLSYKFIGELERGQVNVSLDSIARIADALGVKAGDLFPREVDIFPQFSSQDLQLIKKALRLLNRTFSKV